MNINFFRHPLEETPTHTGGVSQQALNRIHSRARKRDSHGLYVSSSFEGRDGGHRDRKKEEKGHHKR